MRLEQLQYIVITADCKSVSKAAKKIYVSQPALSNSIKNLENELGFTIFDRTIQGVTLTPKGKELYKIACSIQQNLDRIVKLSNKFQYENEICIGAVPMACGFSFMDMIDSIRIAFPRLKLTVNELRPLKLWEELQKERIRFAVSSCIPTQKKIFSNIINDIHLVNETLMSCPMLAFLPINHPLADQSFVSISEFKNENIYCFQDAEQPIIDFKDLFYDSVIHYMSSRSSIKEAIARKKGIAFLPATMAIDDIYIESKKIKVVPLKENSFVYVELIHPQNSLLSQQENTILEIIRNHFRKTNAIIRTICKTDFKNPSANNIDIFY